MSKTKGFKVRIDAFVALDPKDYKKTAAAYAAMDEISRTKKLPEGFLDNATILDVSAKMGTAEIPAAGTGSPDDPAAAPLTTDPLPEGATVLSSATVLDGTIVQTVKLKDGSEVARRISADQAKAEAAAAAKPPGGKRGK